MKTAPTNDHSGIFSSARVTPLKPSLVALLIDEEPQVRRLLRTLLEGSGYRVFDAATGQDGILQAAQCRPNVVVLDLGLRDFEGLKVLKRIREWSRVPVLILSVGDREEDKIVALDNGADDFMTKPFGTGELLARLRAAIRHVQPHGSDAHFRCGRLQVDLAAQLALKDGKKIKLTQTEYSLLRLLVIHAGKVLTHRQLLTEVWGPNAVMKTHYLRVFIASLRRKLEQNHGSPEMLITESGVGYRFVRTSGN
jgi:two-component system KDP operon response regulator KdpE